MEVRQSTERVRVMARNFYGGLKVRDTTGPPYIVRSEMHGAINHGQQYLDPQRRDWPTAYYGWNSGAGLAIREASGPRAQSGGSDRARGGNPGGLRPAGRLLSLL